MSASDDSNIQVCHHSDYWCVCFVIVEITVCSKLFLVFGFAFIRRSLNLICNSPDCDIESVSCDVEISVS